MNLVDRIRHQSPCQDACDWLAQQKSAAQAWQDCERGDWMLWLVGRQITNEPWSDDRKPILLCALECAETVKHLWPNKHAKIISNSVKVLRQWCEGNASAEEANKARKELSAAAAYAYAAAAAAAYDAADAAAAAAAAAYAAAAYAAAAYAAAAYAAARIATLKQCAGIVRKHFPKPPKIRKPA